MYSGINVTATLISSPPSLMIISIPWDMMIDLYNFLAVWMSMNVFSNRNARSRSKMCLSACILTSAGKF